MIAFVENGVRHPIASDAIRRINFAKRPVTTLTEEAFLEFPEGTPVMLKNGVVIKMEGDVIVYSVSEGTRRPFANRETFKALGYKEEKILTVDAETIALHSLGEPIEFFK